MRQKTQKLVITFHTTTEAMAAEQTFLRLGLPGRLIPVPRQITAGCGLAWMAPCEAEEMLLAASGQETLSWENWQKLIL